ncbi:MAG TPA: nucleotide exchange factor GrpE [Alphaproteobacteria bacterium]|nr:nucleotide exchange factor GrpE [Alphaproteobacteria bacterium]
MQAESPQPEDFDHETTAAETAVEDIGEVETEFASAEEQILALQNEVSAQKDRALRALAEAENTRRRAMREKEEANRYGIMEFAREMLSVADNFTMALNAVTPEVRENPAIESVMAGIEMTQKQLQSALERFGVRQFDPIGTIFDPNVHDVFMEVENTGQPPGTITNVIQAGYTIHDRLLRPARVAVAKGAPDAKKIDTKV